MSRRRAFANLLLTMILLPVAAGWLAYSHRSVSVSCQRANGQVHCSETERIADQNLWTQPVWSATVDDVTLTARDVDDEGNPGAVILRTRNDTVRVQFTSGELGTNEPSVESELHQFLVVRTADPSLQLDLPPGGTWRDWAAPAGLGVLLAGLMLYSVFRLIVPSRPRAKMRRQTPSGG